MSSEDSPESSAQAAQRSIRSGTSPSPSGAEFLSAPSSRTGERSETEAEVSPESDSDAQSSAHAESDAVSAESSVGSAEAALESESASENAEASNASETDTANGTDTASVKGVAPVASGDSISSGAGMVETFETSNFGTLEEHAVKHGFPAHVSTCGPCKFWNNRWKWCAEFSCLNQTTQKNETWLGIKNGHAICLICAADEKCAATKTLFGKGLGSLMATKKFTVHAKCGPHESARQLWQQRLRAEAVQGEIVSSGSATAVPAESAAAESATRTREPQALARAVVAARALLETSGAFNSLDVWLAALAGEERHALESQWHCKRLVSTMAEFEKAVTNRVLREGTVFRLQADGLDRHYQVEIGAVLWSLPSFLKHLPSHGEPAGWLRQLGPRGPWIVERIIGMQEFPHDMGCDGKASMLEACVRRACLAIGGELDTKLHQHVREQTRAWCSDGADLQVPLAASASFPGLAFHAWDESHSSQRLLANAMTAVEDDEEIVITDKLLVTGKKPYSLAKFLSTSIVFRKTVGDAQMEDDIAFVKNFGWAPQRYSSRARPYARESRRWNSIFDAVATEAAGSNMQRRILAKMYLGELGGENSSRLLLGGLLADLSAEHYAWVKTGDKGNPDSTTVHSRADAFVARLDVLFNESVILTLPDTYTGVTLKFLNQNRYFQSGKCVQSVGIGNWQEDAAARRTIQDALRRVRCLVANIKEYMKLYRPEHSWLCAFTACRLPSPLSSGSNQVGFASSSSSGPAQVGGRARAEADASLRRICREAKLRAEQACRELYQLLPRAEKHYAVCPDARVAWGRAAAEWPELKDGRRLVELFLVWKTQGLAIWSVASDCCARFDAPSELECLTYLSKIVCSRSKPLLAKCFGPFSRLPQLLSRRLHQLLPRRLG